MCKGFRIVRRTLACGIILQMPENLYKQHHIIPCSMRVGVRVLQSKVAHEITKAMTTAPFWVNTQFREQRPTNDEGINTPRPHLQKVISPEHGI